MPVLDLTQTDNCLCGWRVPRDVVACSDTPEFIPDDTEVEYRCPQCGLKHFICLVRTHETKPAN